MPNKVSRFMHVYAAIKETSISLAFILQVPASSAVLNFSIITIINLKKSQLDVSVLYRLNQKWKFLRNEKKIIVSYTLFLEPAVILIYIYTQLKEKR